ncbi:AraC family transcriptional regulator [Paenibacillus albus]|uniref:AraC family transcriptional regulator n=1 Tax=Paenibacillus albus TaxID=2495582 RepID=A0A3Q8XB03_9BACL|nr:AraC family transcriptional regulator [Paenibacillus albus]AZN42921.1 AraC family transcriptional regulator [Paenibacillus albus]
MKEYANEFAEFLYYTPSLQEKEERIWPIRAGRNLAKPNYSVGPKQIECYSIHFVRSGVVLFEYPGGSVELAKGDLFVLFPQCSYAYKQMPVDERLQMYWIAFDGSGAEALIESVGLTRDQPYRKRCNTEQIIDGFKQLLDELRTPAYSGHSGSLRLHSLLYRLFSEMTVQGQDQLLRKNNWIEASIAYMKLHYMDKISVQDVAASMGLNRTYFATVFTEQMGLSPKAYLQKLQMEKAKQLLGQNTATITEIALTLGYPNLFSFSRSFRNYYGYYPKAYRES